MKLTEVNVADLSGPALNWGIAKALGWVMARVPNDIDGKHGGEVLAPPTVSVGYKFPPRGQIGPGYFLLGWSRDWAFGGPLINQYEVSVQCYDGSGKDERKWCAYLPDTVPMGADEEVTGPTPLIAACRAIVSAKLGPVVKVPSELVGGAA